MMSGGSGFADGGASFVLDALPTFAHVDRASPSAEAVARTLEFLRMEISSVELGDSLVA